MIILLGSSFKDLNKQVGDMLENLGSFFKNLLFPVSCVSCGDEGLWCCGSCLALLPIRFHQQCPLCQKPTSNGEACPDCLPSSHLDGVTALYDYRENSPVAKLIKTCKYRFSDDISTVLPDLVRKVGVEVWAHLLRQKGVLNCVPVPLHPRRERERGFNQAALISQAVAAVWSSLGLVVDARHEHLLARVRYTTPQAELGAVERRTNLKGAFSCNSLEAVPEQVVLIDDVFTTGSTMQECAHMLKQHGVKWVWGVVLARG